jgi:hypothetical protein
MIGSRALRRFEQKHADFERAAEVCCHAVTSSALTDAIVCARAPGPAGTGSVALRDWGWRLGNHWAAQVDANALSAYLIHCKLYLLVRSRRLRATWAASSFLPGCGRRHAARIPSRAVVSGPQMRPLAKSSRCGGR